jgi:hypothetical protein
MYGCLLSANVNGEDARRRSAARRILKRKHSYHVSGFVNVFMLVGYLECNIGPRTSIHARASLRNWILDATRIRQLFRSLDTPGSESP